MRWSEKQRQTIRAPFTHVLEVNEGTPRSGKTTAAVFRFARHLIETTDRNHLIVAFNQEQAFKLVLDCDGLGLQHIFEGDSRIRHDDHGDHLEVRTPTGVKRVYYKGGGKDDSRKAITGLSLGSVYFCEIDLLNMGMIQECFRRTFAARDRWHIADLNPPAPQHPVIRDVFEVQNTKWTHWTIHDNPVITPERMEEIRTTLEKNPYLYARDWLGERTMPQGVIYAMFDEKRHVLPKLPEDGEIVDMFFAADGGLQDATSVSCNVVMRHRQAPTYRLYRIANWYYSGMDSGHVKALSIQAKEIESAFLPYCRAKAGRRETGFFVDPACRALREELGLLGAPTDPADNNSRDIKGSTRGIAVGIERLQSALANGTAFLVDDALYGHYNFLREVSLYCVGTNGAPVDMYNHCMDEWRYSFNRFFKDFIM